MGGYGSMIQDTNLIKVFFLPKVTYRFGFFSNFH